MRAAIQERMKIAREAIAAGHLVFIRMASSGREYRVFAIGHTQHNLEVILSENDSSWMTFDPEELVAVRVMEVGDA